MSVTSLHACKQGHLVLGFQHTGVKFIPSLIFCPVFYSDTPEREPALLLLYILLYSHSYSTVFLYTTALWHSIPYSGKLSRGKLLQNLRLCGYSWKFSLWNLGVCMASVGSTRSTRENFLLKNRISTNSRKFSLMNIFCYTLHSKYIVHSKQWCLLVYYNKSYYTEHNGSSCDWTICSLVLVEQLTFQIWYIQNMVEYGTFIIWYI